MKSFLFLILPFILIVACEKENHNAQSVLDVNIYITVWDIAGHNLLDPGYMGSFKEDSIKLFYLINGVTEEVYNPNQLYPRNFDIFNDIWPDSSIYKIQISPNIDDSSLKPITYIQWNSYDTDTIICEYRREKGLISCTKVWFNGQLKWDDNKTSRTFQIVK